MFKMRSTIVPAGLVGVAAMLTPGLAKADQTGHASWYSLPANITANGEQMDPGAMTAAHRSLPFGTKVLVENLSNGRFVVVRINDRGPFIGGRIIDLSKGAAASIGMVDSGIAKVRVKITSAEGGTPRTPAKLGNGLIEAGAEVLKKPAPKLAAAKPAAPKQAVAKATPPRSVQKAARKELASAPKASRATSKRAARKQVASIRGAARGAQSLHARREFAVANATRAQKPKEHPYAILGGTPGFMKTVEVTRRRPTPRG